MNQRAPRPKRDKGRAASTGGITALAFFTADHAVQENGKLYVNGGFFNLIMYPVFPAVVPTLGIGASLHIPWRAHHQEHHFAITMLDEEDRELSLRIEGAFRVGADLMFREDEPSVINLAGNVTNLVIERPGRHTLMLHVDDQRLADWMLHAVQVPGSLSTGTAPSSSDA